jgi:hypothetical protein
MSRFARIPRPSNVESPKTYGPELGNGFVLILPMLLVGGCTLIISIPPELSGLDHQPEHILMMKLCLIQSSVLFRVIFQSFSPEGRRRVDLLLW